MELWLAVQTQWRWSPAGTPTGLDYAGVVAAMDVAGVADKRGMMEAIRLMEWETLRVIQDRTARAGGSR